MDDMKKEAEREARTMWEFICTFLKWLVIAGVTGGIGGGLFGSGNTCTRAQIVTFLYRAYQGK